MQFPPLSVILGSLHVLFSRSAMLEMEAACDMYVNHGRLEVHCCYDSVTHDKHSCLLTSCTEDAGLVREPGCTSAAAKNDCFTATSWKKRYF